MDNVDRNIQFFSIDARTIFQLGKEAIESELLAISELVKNAYDSDSPDCLVDFLTTYVRDQNNKQIELAYSIRVEDHGYGMSFEDVQENWLRIGTTNKLKEPFTPNRRRKIGEKGIGRLALNRLGERVEVFSHKANCEPIKLSIDFRQFKNGKDLLTIPVSLIKNPKDFDNDFIGTKIYIYDLLDLWDNTKISEFEKKTISLQNPFSNVSLSNNNEVIHLNNEINQINTNFKIIVLKNHKPFESEIKDLINYITNSLFRAYVEIDTNTNTWKYRYSFHPYDKMTKLKPTIKSVDNYVPITFRDERKIIELKPDKLSFGKLAVTIFAYDFSSVVNEL